MHVQFSCRLALIAVVLPQHRSDEGFPELPHSFGVENPALVHLVYQCVDFASHNAQSLKSDEGMMARKLRSPVGAVNYLNVAKTGSCARLTDGSTVDAKRNKTANCMLLSVRLSDINFLPPVAMRASKRIRDNAWTITPHASSEVLSDVTGTFGGRTDAIADCREQGLALTGPRIGVQPV